jgi:hypothetical protein
MDELNLIESLQPSRFDCVEIYVPKRLKYLSKLYNYLEEKLQSSKLMLTDDPTVAHIDGFSIYEVDGAFRGEGIQSDERTLVIRIFFKPPVEEAKPSVETSVEAQGREVAKIASAEKQVWLSYFPQSVAIFRQITLAD